MNSSDLEESCPSLHFFRHGKAGWRSGRGQIGLVFLEIPLCNDPHGRPFAANIVKSNQPAFHLSFMQSSIPSSSRVSNIWISSWRRRRRRPAQKSPLQLPRLLLHKVTSQRDRHDDGSEKGMPVSETQLCVCVCVCVKWKAKVPPSEPVSCSKSPKSKTATSNLPWSWLGCLVGPVTQTSSLVSDFGHRHPALPAFSKN